MYALTHFGRNNRDLAQNQRANLLAQFVLEIRLQSESLEPLIAFLAFLVPKVALRKHIFGKN